VETVGIRQEMWFLMLESAKDRVIGVDTLGQQVSPRVPYGTACLLISDAVGSVPCSDEWEIGIVTHLGSHGARGAVVPRLPRETLAVLWYCDYLSKDCHRIRSTRYVSCQFAPCNYFIRFWSISFIHIIKFCDKA
jgi:hypothetical protein